MDVLEAFQHVQGSKKFQEISDGYRRRHNEYQRHFRMILTYVLDSCFVFFLTLESVSEVSTELQKLQGSFKRLQCLKPT